MRMNCNGFTAFHKIKKKPFWPESYEQFPNVTEIVHYEIEFHMVNGGILLILVFDLTYNTYNEFQMHHVLILSPAVTNM
jgi:hypothetical protein